MERRSRQPLLDGCRVLKSMGADTAGKWGAIPCSAGGEKMSWRRGFFRLWILGSARFIIVFGALNYSEIKTKFENADFEPALPVRCYNARGDEGKDFERYD